MRVAGVILAFGLVAPSLANAETKTTVYTYNADGALTSITETTEGTPGSTTTYFTWDNFEADPSTPSTGTVTAANGNLVSIGAAPGDDSGSSWQYDVLDRLVRVTNAQRQTAARYRYHPDDLLAASLNANAPEMDGLQHYYDQSRYPQVTNLYDRHTGELSSRHHRVRYLPDGTEQMLVRHRKDVDAVYNLGTQTMSGYGYDPYGASLGQEPTGGTPSEPLYSLDDNPFLYDRQFRDPVSGADYLRARWYLPRHQTFPHRDPFPNLNRYGYANGNPVMNHDPGGGSAKRFFEGIEVGFLSTPNNILAMFGAHYDRHGLSWSAKTLAGYWGSPVNDVVLVATALLAPAASDVAANVDMAFFRGNIFGSEGLDKYPLTLKWRALIGGQKLLSTGVQHVGLNGATLGLQRWVRHWRGERNQQPFDLAFGEAVGGSLGMAQAGFVWKATLELTRSFVSTRFYGRDDPANPDSGINAFRRNAQASVWGRRNLLAARTIALDIEEAGATAIPPETLARLARGNLGELASWSGASPEARQAWRGVRFQTLVATRLFSKLFVDPAIHRVVRRMNAESGSRISFIEDSGSNESISQSINEVDE